MGKVIDLTGQRFGRLVVTGFSHQVTSRFYWRCTCDCGEVRAIWGADLKRGNSESCGCLAKEKRVARMTIHGMNKHPAYRTWMHMRRRCADPTDDGYYLYGARGITVCAAWSASFETFWQDMGATWKRGLSIERRDVNGNYEPNNCTWATPLEQARNRRNNRIINTEWGEMTVSEAATRAGLDVRTVFSRIRYGWPEDQLLIPVRPSWLLEAPEEIPMSYLTDDDLGRELKRLYEAEHGPGDDHIGVDEILPDRIRFYARIGEQTLEFSVPPHELHNCTRDYVSETYLKPLLKRAAKMKKAK